MKGSQKSTNEAYSFMDFVNLCYNLITFKRKNLQKIFLMLKVRTGFGMFKTGC